MAAWLRFVDTFDQSTFPEIDTCGSDFGNVAGVSSLTSSSNHSSGSSFPVAADD